MKQRVWVAACVVLLSCGAHAQTFPTRPVRVIVPHTLAQSRFDPVKDFAPVTQTTSAPFILARWAPIVKEAGARGE